MSSPVVSISAKLAEYDAQPAPTPTPIDTLQVIRLDAVQPKPIEWLWPGWLPKGMLTILGGYAGDGKSTVSLALAAALSTGSPLPDGATAPITNTLLLLAEDDLRHVVRPRLDAHGADPTRFFSPGGADANGLPSRTINLRTDIARLRQMILAHEIGLIIIDPLTSFLAASDRNSEGEVRDNLGPLLKLMEETGVAAIGIMHVGKNDGYQRSMQRLMGSTAFTALARSVWMVHPLPEDMQEEDQPVRKVLGVVKSNYAVAPAPLLFSRPLDGPVEYHGQSSVSLDDLVNARRERAAGPTGSGSAERDKAKEFLYAFLAGGMKRPVEIERAAAAEDIGKRILRRAKEEMNVQSIKVKDLWYWSLPLPGTKPGEQEPF